MNLSNLPWPAIMVAIGSAIAIVGAFWGAIEQGKSERKIGELQEKNAQLSEDIQFYLKGGDSYPLVTYLEGLTPNSTKDHVTGIIGIQGDYPLFDLSFNHHEVSLDELLNTKEKEVSISEIRQSTSKSQKNSLSVRLANAITPEISSHVGTYQFTGNEIKCLRFNTYTRHANYCQRTLLGRKKTGEWNMIYYEVTKTFTQKGKKLMKL